MAPVGLLLIAAGFLVFSTAGTDSSYWLLLGGLIPLGVGMALATTPATTAIVSSLPKAKQGVASAVNDLRARSVRARHRGAGQRPDRPLPVRRRRRHRAAARPSSAHAQDALPAALAISQQLGPRGANLAASGQSAFVDGLGVATLIGAGALAIAAIFVFWRAPREGAVTERGRTPVSNARLEAE